MGIFRKNGGTQYLTTHYLPENVVALMCFWKTRSRIVIVILIRLCDSLQKESPTKYSGLWHVEKLFWYSFSIPLKYKDNFTSEIEVSRKRMWKCLELLSPSCISTTIFHCCNWESNSDSCLLPQWREHIGLCISGDVVSYFKVPKRSLNGNMKQNKYEYLIYTYTSMWLNR